MHTPTYLKCECPHCAQPIEYPKELAATQFSCPACENELIFPELPSEHPPIEVESKPGLLRGMIEKYRATRAAAADKSAFKDHLLMAVADGVLTEDEVDTIARRKDELGLDNEFLVKHAASLLEVGTKAIMAGGYCSPQEMESISLMAANLGTRLEDHSNLFRTLVRGSLKHQLRYEPLRPISVSNALLQPAEMAYWQEPATLYEEKVISRRYEGGSRGVSFRVAKGVSFRVGNHRGQLISETGNVAVSTGALVVTNQRLIFVGDGKSFSALHGKIFQLETASDGIRFAESNKQKPRLILFHIPNGDLVFEVLSRLLSL